MLKLELTKKHFLKIFAGKKNLKVILLSSLIFYAQLSCNVTEPTDDFKPGRSNYTWTVIPLIFLSQLCSLFGEVLFQTFGQ